jgi:hypothetical protein
MATPKKPPPTFEVEFNGPGIYPEHIPLGTLTRALSAVQRLALGDEVPDTEEADQTLEGKVSLLQMRRGSAICVFRSELPELAIDNLRETGAVLERPERIGDKGYILSPVEELSAVARTLHSSIVVRKPGREGMVLATIGPDSYASMSRTVLTRGDAALPGKVVRVGGATEQKCGLRVTGRSRMLICTLESAEVARKLGQKLYEQVVVHGEATWLRTNWTVVGFKIREVHQPRLGEAEEMIQALRNAGGSAWDQIDDPQAYLEEVTGER